MLTEGIIRPSSSPWSFPVILVKKRDGKYRFCVDYRKLNNVTVKDVYPIPRIDEVMDTLQGSTHFSAIDLRSGYWQVEVEERDKEKTAFTTAHGLYEFNVMPFGLCNASATFERNMENMLGNLRWQICLCYLDDVIIYSPDFPTHLKRLEAVFRCFRESNLRLNDKKCRFAFEELEILGYITSKHERQEEAFQTLKTALLSPPILGHFNPNAPTYVHTDASNIGIGATLVQDIGGEEKVISYLSRTLSKAEQNYSTTEKECLAVVWSMSKLRPYLYGRHFKIVTDHHALCWLKNLKDPTGRLARWALKIQEYDFDIIHKSGKKHLDADGLSRGPLPETDWDEDFERLFLNQITDEEDKFIESVKKNLNGSRRSIAQNFKEEDGCLFKKNPNPEGRAWLLVVPENKKREIMKEYHNHMSNGHLGVARTMYRIKSKYFWPSMLKDVSEFVKTCHLCQSRKGSNQLPSGLLQPIPPANFPFERIGIDFVGPLPSTKNRKKWIIVLTDYYTRYAETRAVSEATVKEVSKFLVEDIFLRHGAPQYLISDRGSQFTSNLMKEVMKTCKIKHCFTTSYHPQTNGLTERLNRTLINMLSMYVNTDQKNWDEILPFITHAYNTTIQETTGYSPFFLMFGREPTSLLDDRNISVDIDKDDYDQYIKHHLDKINRTRKLVINNTIKTQERMKKNYDKKHMERSYEPGELVAVWTPIRKIGKCEKLLRKYFGPYRILKKLSNVNYLIEPKDNPGQDPLIVHVSRLKPYFERIDEVTHEDVTTSGEGEVCVREFENGRTGVHDEPRAGWPSVLDETFAKVEAAMLDDRRVCARWVPKMMTEDHKRQRVEAAQKFLDCHETDGEEFLDSIVIGDETWVHYTTPETREQSKQWKHFSSPKPLKFKQMLSAGKLMATIFWDRKGILLCDFMRRGTTVNSDRYCETLKQLRRAIKNKRRGMLTKGVRFHYDNSRSPTARQTTALFAEFEWELVSHPPYSSDVAPNDFYLFPELKKNLGRTQFQDDDELEEAVLGFLRGQAAEFFDSGLHNVTELRRSRRLQGREPILQPLPQRIEMEDEHRPTVSGSYLPCQRQRDPSTFSGDGNINPGQWLKEYERVSKYNRWDETMKLANVVFYLNGTAGRWFDNNEESLNSWRSFEDAFRGVFGLQEDSARRAEEVLKSRAQKAEESSESYIQEILSLCHQVNPRMEEGEMVAHIIKGISEDTYQVLVAKDIQTVDEILKFCRHLTTVKQRRIGRTKFARLSNVMPISCVDDSDDLAGLIRRIVREEIQKVFSAPEVINPLREVNALEQTVREEVSRSLQPTRPQVNVVQQQPRTPYYNIDRPTQHRKTEHWRTYDDKPICFHCGRPGHVVRYCRERRQVFAEARTRNGGEGRNVGFSSRPPRYDADDDYPRKVASPKTIPVANPSFQPFSQASECEKLSGAASNGGEVAIEENPPGYIAAKLKENFVMVEINGRKIKALVDSGADFSVISDKFRRELKTPLFKEPGPILKAANKNLIETLGKCVLNIEVNGLKISFEFVVMVECSHDIIFGWDFFKATEAVIDCGRNELHLGETSVLESREEEKQRLFASDDFVIPPKSIKKISVINEEVCGVRDVLVSTSKDLLLRKEVLIPNSLVTFRHGRGSIWKINLTLDPGLSEIQRLQLVSCLDEFIDIFDFGSTSIKPTSTVKHKINKGDHSHIKQRPYRVAPSERRLIQDEVNKMIENHIVKPSESPWSSPVILVRKKDGTWRFCVDYRRLNKITKKDVYPLPRIDDALDSLAGSSYFSTMDLRSGYWQIEVDEKDREKTAFITPDGLYEFQVMPFGLCNAPATFERMIDSVLGSLKWNMCLCYLDDIVVYAPTFEEHLRRLQLVLNCIQKAGLSLNHKKCLFGSRRIKILGHLVDANGIHPDPDKVEAVSKFPRPRNISELRSFLGLCSYYRRFIENFADKARSLHDLLKTEKQFYWDAAQEKAFEVLKTALISEPVLGHFDESADTHLHTDASGHGIGAVLLQIQGGKERPIAYASRSLTKAENNYSTTEKECLAVVWSISKFRPYLFGRPFTVVTDHHSLCWLVGQKDPSGRLARWALKLQEFDVTVIYKSGRKHKDADCLSRSPLENDPPSAVMSLTNVDIEQTKDPDLAKIIDNLNSGYTRKEFSIIDGILYKKNYSTTGRPWLMMIPKHLRSEVMADLHDAPTAGHLGFARTYDKVKKRFYWPGLYRTVRQYVSHCRECQRRKKLTRRPAGQLVSIPPVEKPFYKVGVDLLGRFPVSKDGNRWIIVCTDYMTRYAITKAIPDGGAIETAKFLVEDVILKHGAPREMITDRGRNFISQVIKQINALCGIVHRFTTAYHPQTNGLTERFNKSLGDMLSMYTGVEQKDWDQVLPYVTFAYNTAKQEATGYTPFFLVHAREAETYIDAVLPYLPDEISDDYVGELVTRAEEARQLSRSRLLQSQAKDRRLYDQKHTPVYYQKDDLVWVFTPIRKVGLSEKLLKKYFGPYKVTKKLSEVTYEVEPVDPSPRSRKSKDIVHVIRMKPYLDPEEQHSILLGNTGQPRTIRADKVIGRWSEYGEIQLGSSQLDPKARGSPQSNPRPKSHGLR
ncbi:hypothetical protein LAZ67_9001818 [Cordylochernes scorpioides]|uniref:RNA-directed DNA polymerase n=1 Tax=Cordylochernes scorpioides TaxID=51811 RepID=A0ABY6KWM7_9ARAC|nr:hypothetical protein LAZ67_9001818 [Cordylochernes scorpioides]